MLFQIMAGGQYVYKAYSVTGVSGTATNLHVDVSPTATTSTTPPARSDATRSPVRSITRDVPEFDRVHEVIPLAGPSNRTSALTLVSLEATLIVAPVMERCCPDVIKVTAGVIGGAAAAAAAAATGMLLVENGMAAEWGTPADEEVVGMTGVTGVTLEERATGVVGETC
jgi:hypothetical protein